METYYKCKSNGRMYSASRLQIVNDIYGDSTINLSVLAGILTPVEDITVIDLLKNGARVEAIKLYKDTHDCTLKRAFNQVKLIEADIKKFNIERSKNEN